MIKLFTAVLNMSITASYVALAVIAVRLFIKKTPKVFSYVLWLPVLIRLVSPFSFDSAFSFLRFLNSGFQTSAGVMEYIPYDVGLMQNPVVDVGIDGINQAVNSSLAPGTPTASVSSMEIILELAGNIWVIGMIILLIYCVISYLKVINKVKTATMVKDNIFETDRITAPFLCGFIKPKIYVPVGLKDNELAYILAHEQTHMQRLDHLTKPFAFLVLIVHWFNPLMWVSFALMSKDMEMSCDESVIKKMGNAVRGGYSTSLLALSVKRSGLIPGSPLAFGESNIKSRIENILNYKKPAFWVVVLAIIGTASLIVAFTANPKHEPGAPDSYLGYPVEALMENKTPNVGINAAKPAAENTKQKNAEIEKYLEIIISSPKLSSNPYDYIKAHQTEYETILKMGDTALDYLLAQFAEGGHNDLKGYIMMEVCKDLLGDRNNVTDNILSPQDWFSRLSPYEEVKLPDFKARGADPLKQLVYDAAVKQYSRPGDGFTVVAPTSFGSYEEGNKLKIFVTVFSSSFKLYNKTLSQSGGSVVPAAITYVRDNNGKYTLLEYRECRDGSDFGKSIKDFCTMPVSGAVIQGLYDKIMKDYGSNKDRNELMIENLEEHLKANNQENIIMNFKI